MYNVGKKLDSSFNFIIIFSLQVQINSGEKEIPEA